MFGVEISCMHPSLKGGGGLCCLSFCMQIVLRRSFIFFVNHSAFSARPVEPSVAVQSMVSLFEKWPRRFGWSPTLHFVWFLFSDLYDRIFRSTLFILSTKTEIWKLFQSTNVRMEKFMFLQIRRTTEDGNTMRSSEISFSFFFSLICIVFLIFKCQHCLNTLYCGKNLK